MIFIRCSNRRLQHHTLYTFTDFTVTQTIEYNTWVSLCFCISSGCWVKVKLNPVLGIQYYSVVSELGRYFPGQILEILQGFSRVTSRPAGRVSQAVCRL